MDNKEIKVGEVGILNGLTVKVVEAKDGGCGGEENACVFFEHPSFIVCGDAVCWKEGRDDGKDVFFVLADK